MRLGESLYFSYQVSNVSFEWLRRSVDLPETNLAVGPKERVFRNCWESLSDNCTEFSGDDACDKFYLKIDSALRGETRDLAASKLVVISAPDLTQM